MVKGLIYPVPDPPTRSSACTSPAGSRAASTSAQRRARVQARGLRRTDFSAADLLDVSGPQGFRRLARKHWRMGAAEMWGSVSTRAFIARAPRLHPGADRQSTSSRAPAGVRAQAIDPDGSLVDDFRITRVGGLFWCEMRHRRRPPHPSRLPSTSSTNCASTAETSALDARRACLESLGAACFAAPHLGRGRSSD